jgi:uncharacterized protein (UPF0335 family)
MMGQVTVEMVAAAAARLAAEGENLKLRTPHFIAHGREELKSYIERIERIVEEIVALKDDQRVLFAEAKAKGYDTKAMRRIIKRRQKDPTELAEAETIDGTYMHALGMQAEQPAARPGRAPGAGRHVAREQVIEALQLLIPVNGEIIASVGGSRCGCGARQDGQACAEDYVPPLFEQFMKKRKAT